jgi:hypothetical protein
VGVSIDQLHVFFVSGAKVKEIRILGLKQVIHRDYPID